MSAFIDVFGGLRDDFHARASQPNASDDVRVLDQILNGPHPDHQAYRIHLAAWLEFCRELGGLTKDRISRLQSLGSMAEFDQVLNELRIPYFLHRVYGMDMEYVVGGGVDVVARTQGSAISVEIKTPGQEAILPPPGARMLGKDEGSIVQALRSAARQFSTGEMNVLAVGGQCLERRPVRDDLYVTQALYGREKLVGSLNVPTGQVAGNSFRSEFFPDGRLQHNRFTRIGAVLVFDDGYFLGPAPGYKAPHRYYVSLYHNPHASIRIPEALFPHTQQLCFDALGRLFWRNRDHTTFTFRGY